MYRALSGLTFSRFLSIKSNMMQTSVLASPPSPPRAGHTEFGMGRGGRPFWGPLADILDFAGGASLQAVSERPLRR